MLYAINGINGKRLLIEAGRGLLLEVLQQAWCRAGEIVIFSLGISYIATGRVSSTISVNIEILVQHVAARAVSFLVLLARKRMLTVSASASCCCTYVCVCGLLRRSTSARLRLMKMSGPPLEPCLASHIGLAPVASRACIFNPRACHK